ncbi:shikimate dehydrogenase [Candidatus Kaiserbacteria bacterium RIFCSPHIGHO2_02_FULL_59_21]|uniref:Shikimate dehydrogenase (NADP(+)) n=2 Tax=Candidatus Kaiseribacteriota TaxID=1752734 RepID=A0A0G2B219_9BACT|nr:MAG: Shikimate dehydrogenase [Candidatus Kaiserbacteria bacterium GW2011_GWA2_58_9]OGG62000.1 MAG: shikimate dehydrogenase [Candidatus Kaiserbacteria bacterium RIFCSPHIGHO2_01_FULL_58_22]OGG67230.1 MAG: shikimate dehydrogenase [Candidatus Kaiserbacteria bacterium RIFCSPHIGHO2_02_FULL_59_21]OGG79871.1 MAG: shikimate dehydrogenase [Candidatus Kaiserbacteria bacterium RIFCSPLOWO2_01_FULL_59_34]OGG85508.1 MAG: shikimate dehydrogenase [Candidatus Kaiserbacteria bacterium RIFCSPLOWO2_02_FULL_59_19
MITPATKLTAVLGDPVTHSLSPLLHNAIYEKEGVDAVYLAFGNPEVEPLIAAMRALPIHHAAVTMPHKQTIMPFLDTIDEEARAIGAVNTVINRDGKLHGYNTDVVGVAKALEAVPLKGTNALVIGAGGAARTVVYHLSREGANVFVHNREEKQARELCDVFGCTVIGESEIAKREYGLIVNATPIGMRPDVDSMPVAAEMLHAGIAVFDLVYSPLETKLLRTAKEKGAKPTSGLIMFLAQGLEQERLWLGRDIEQTPYEKLLEEHIRMRDS